MRAFLNSMEIFSEDKNLCFNALKKAQKMGPASVIAEIKISGLRGRGGAGFPTGLKWEIVNQEQNKPKYVACNAHEGETETLKDKYILENFPHLVLGGMLIAAEALDASEIFIAVKETYKEAIKIFKKEVAIFQKKGFLKSIKIIVLPAKLGYVGGEESAVLNEIEGKRIEPRPKPPFVASIGLFNKPTLINNVETFANIPYIVNRGSQEFRKFGTEGSPGQKLITVARDVKKPGIYGIEFGKTLNDILELAGGPKGKIKFVLTGGFAGTVVPPGKFNIPFEYDSFGRGVAVGAGTIIFYNDKRNLLSSMKEWLEFFKNESCGQCTPCREGTFRLYEIVTGAKNKLSKKDVQKMEDIFEALDNSSFCPLGMSVSMAPKGLLAYFRKELVR